MTTLVLAPAPMPVWSPAGGGGGGRRGRARPAGSDDTSGGGGASRTGGIGSGTRPNVGADPGGRLLPVAIVIGCSGGGGVDRCRGRAVGGKCVVRSHPAAAVGGEVLSRGGGSGGALWLGRPPESEAVTALKHG